MLIKGLIGGARLGAVLPVFAAGVVAGALVSRAPKRQRGCKRCCLSCNGSCRSDQFNTDTATESDAQASRSDFSI